jgi:hypothetical protein
MTDNNEGIDRLDSLFGPPPLLAGEDPKRYERLRAAIVANLDPKSALEWIDAQDQVTKVWEEQRYRSYAAALINGGMLRAVDYYLEQTCEPDYAEDLGSKFISGNAKERKEVLSVLADNGITTAELQAKAAELEGNGLQLFERMVAHRENGRRLLRKEADRRRNDPDVEK